MRPARRLAEDAFELAAPGLDLYDAIFGAAHVRGSGEAVARLSRLAFDTAERLPHALLNWWMPNAIWCGPKRRERRSNASRREDSGNWRIDYLFDIWAMRAA